MKSVLRGLLAAVIGCAIFFACLVGWYELTGQGDGVFPRREEDAGTAVTVVGTEQNPDVTLAPASGAGNAQGEGAGNVQGSGNVPGEGAGGEAQQNTAPDAGNADTGDSAAMVLVPTEEPLQDSADDAASEDAALNAYVDLIKLELSETYGDHLKVERSQRGITITLWEDGLVDRLAAGQADGNTETLWNEKKEALRQITNAYYYRREDEGVGNTHIIANLLNEKQPDDIILSYEDGSLVHDGLDHD